MPGAGASSITFWWRRCSEQSRSNRWTTLPWLSPNTCTSIWRGRWIYFSISTRSSPNDAAASRWQRSERVGKVCRRIDLAHALAAAAGDRLDQHRIADLRRLRSAGARPTGPRPDSRASRARPPRAINFLAASFSPMARIAAGGGADPDQPGVDHRLGELGILGQEAIAGMDRLGARCLRAAAMILSPTR